MMLRLKQPLPPAITVHPLGASAAAALPLKDAPLLFPSYPALTRSLVALRAMHRVASGRAGQPRGVGRCVRIFLRPSRVRPAAACQRS